MKQSDIYKMIEDKVISQLEKGIIPWRKCYHVNNSLCVSHQTGTPYSFLNQFLLQDPGEYWTFASAIKSGYGIRKGASARKVVFWKVLEIEDDSTGDTDKIPFLRYYNVFHESDVIGLPEKHLDVEKEDLEAKRRNMESIPKCDEIIANYLNANKDITMTTSDRTPCFAPSSNTIYIPAKSQFDKLEDYYSTVFHEIIHSTKKALRPNTIRTTESYAREELVAEIGAAYLCGRSRISDQDVIKNNASYCAYWLEKLEKDIKILIWASARAEKASKFVLNEQDKQENANGDEQRTE